MHENGRSLAQVIAELRSEVKDFVRTRYQMLAQEMREKARLLKLALPAALLGGAVLGVGLLVLTVSIVNLIAIAFGPPLGWLWATLIVGGGYVVLGAALLAFAYRELSAAGMAPRRTLRVLQQDQAWLQTEAKTL